MYQIGKFKSIGVETRAASDVSILKGIGCYIIISKSIGNTWYHTHWLIAHGNLIQLYLFFNATTDHLTCLDMTDDGRGLKENRAVIVSDQKV